MFMLAFSPVQLDKLYPAEHLMRNVQCRSRGPSRCRTKRVRNRISQTWHLSRCACATKDKMSVRDKEGKQMLSLLKIRWFVGVQLTIMFIKMSMKNTHSEVQ